MISSFKVSSYDYKAPYLSYLDAFKSDDDDEDSIDSERLYNSFVSILKQIDQDQLNKLQFNTISLEPMKASNIRVDENKRTNQTFVKFKHKDIENITNIIRFTLSEVNLINKTLLKMILKINYIISKF